VSLPKQHGDLEPMERAACDEALASAPFVRIAFVLDGRPTILPVNHVMLDGDLFFRTEAGSKLAAAAAQAPVAVEADGADTEHRVGWSVVVHGRSSIVTDTALLERLHALNFTPWSAPDAKVFWIRIGVDEVGGRRIIG
jgi:uncharacterized protein